MNPYERIEVMVSNMELLSARPIEFREQDGIPVEALRYETTCPKCGAMIQFSPEDVTYKDEQGYIGCLDCDGADYSKRVSDNTPRSVIRVDSDGQNVSFTKYEDRGCPFVDPIKLEQFDPMLVDF